VGKDLVVGPTGLLDLKDWIAPHLTERGVAHDMQTWLTAECDVTLCCLNVASVFEFLRHVVQCEGVADEAAGFRAGETGKSRYGNMPWWEHSIWLPVELRSGNLQADPTIFVGSCVALLRELRDLQDRSPLRLGSAPPGYQEMRADIRQFYRSTNDLHLTEEDCVRWVWLVLRDGAELAMTQNTALCSEPG